MLRRNKVWLLLVGAVALLALLTVACGGGEKKQGTQTPAASGTAAGTPRAPGTPTVTKTATPRPTTTAAANATPTPVVTDPGVTDTQIILGSHFTQSGTYGASFAPVLAGLQAYFGYVNAEKGGVCGREIVLKAEDDNYKPAQAVEVTRKLVEQDQVFAMIADLGTEAHSAVWDYLNERGIPDLWVMSGAHKWGADPQGHPWTVGFLPDYFVEGAIFGKWISENMPGAKVGILYQDDDFGRDILAGLQNGLDPTKNELVSPQSYEPTAVTIHSQVEYVRQAGAEVVVCGCIPGHAAQAIKGADSMGWKPQWLLHYSYPDATFITEPPQLPEGILALQYHKRITQTDDTAIAKHYEMMEVYGTMAPDHFTIVGQLAGELTVEALSRTCDNLTRRGLMDAVESLRDYQSDLNLPGITWTLSPDDHIGIEAMRFLRAKVDDGRFWGTWEPEGDLISFR